MISLDSAQCINTANLPSGKPTIFIYFSPDCEHCQQEAKMLLAHQKELHFLDIYMVTNGALDEARKFYKVFRLDTVQNIFVVKDYEYSFYKVYLPPTTPFIAIYDGEKKLRKIYREEVTINSIINSVRD